LLNLVFSTQAAYAAPIIMMAQNRQSQRDRAQADSDYRTNVQAKKEIEELMKRLDTIEIEKLDKIITLLEKELNRQKANQQITKLIDDYPVNLKTNYSMKKIIYLSVIAIAALTFQSCHNGAKDAKQTADSLNKTKDTTSNAMNTGGIAVTSDDAKFATEAANGGMAEVALGKLALTKTSNSAIKNFAQMMITDHGKANDELMAIAKTKNITLPAEPDSAHMKKADELGQMNGTDFDKAYVKTMIDGHKKTLDLMNKEAKDGKDADLKAFAAKTAPIVQMHLDAINKIHDSMK
jgi:putative membrane protein